MFTVSCKHIYTEDGRMDGGEGKTRLDHYDPIKNDLSSLFLFQKSFQNIQGLEKHISLYTYQHAL